MELLGDVTTKIGVDQSTAESGLGAIFTTLRLSLDSKTFDHIKEAEPGVDGWVGKTIIGGGRTGEMLSLVGPHAFSRNLSGAGFSTEQGEELLDIVFDHICGSLPEEIGRKVLAKRPVLATD